MLHSLFFSHYLQRLHSGASTMQIKDSNFEEIFDLGDECIIIVSNKELGFVNMNKADYLEPLSICLRSFRQ